MKHLPLLLLLLLTACPGGKGASVNWDARPHQDTVPRPFGAWAIAPTTRVDVSRVYTYGGATVPAWILPAAAEELSAAVDAQLAYSTANGIPRKRVTSGENILVCLYYNPAQVTRQSASVQDGDLTVTPEDGKKASAVPQPPAASANLAGQAQMRAHGDTITGATVWINASYYQTAYILQLRKGKSEADARATAITLMRRALPTIIWHEGGHALWGLADDVRGDLQGLMCYRNMTAQPVPREWDVALWLWREAQ